MTVRKSQEQNKCRTECVVSLHTEVSRAVVNVFINIFQKKMKRSKYKSVRTVNLYPNLSFQRESKRNKV